MNPPQPDQADVQSVRDRLLRLGMSTGAASDKATLFARLARAQGTSDRTGFWYVPGRLELLGKHTDYAGGHSLVCPVDRGLCLLARARPDEQVTMHDLTRDQRRSFTLADPPAAFFSGDWINYPATVARRLRRNFPAMKRGMDLAFASDLPPAAGLSSSSAMIVAFLLIFADVNDLHADSRWRTHLRSDLDLAGYAGSIENGSDFRGLCGEQGVGTFGGSEDHAAIVCGRPGQLTRFAFRPLTRLADLPFPPDHRIVVANSGVVAEKTGDARERYNRAARLAATLETLWTGATGQPAPSLAGVVDQSRDAPRLLNALIDRVAPAEQRPALHDRLAQFRIEHQRVIPRAAAALADGDLAQFGRLVHRSQLAAERRLGNQVEQTSWLVGRAGELGAVAASAFGAGFGGSVWAMVRADGCEAFIARWREAYRRHFPADAERSSFIPVEPSVAATRL